MLHLLRPRPSATTHVLLLRENLLRGMHQGRQGELSQDCPRRHTRHKQRLSHGHGSVCVELGWARRVAIRSASGKLSDVP